jgi:peptidoglycan L-alanyl-D-glutamate endopeptidase CwlK
VLALAVPAWAQESDEPVEAGLVVPECYVRGSCERIELVQPAGCTPKRRWWHERRTQLCESERALVLFMDPEGQLYGGQWLPDREAPKDPVPEELLHVWRRCGEGAVPGWPELPVVFARFEDPDVGPCLVANLLAAPVPDDIAKKARVKGLDSSHPYVRWAGRQLVRQAWEEGIEIKVISGYRKYAPRVERKPKRGRGPRYLVSWHHFGLALDINMTWAKGLGEAARKRREDPEEHARWERLGEIGRSLGLRWGGNMNSDDIFHFEWHPGYGGRLTPKELGAFLQLAGRSGLDYEATWVMLEPGARERIARAKEVRPKIAKAKPKKSKKGKATKAGKGKKGKATKPAKAKKGKATKAPNAKKGKATKSTGKGKAKGAKVGKSAKKKPKKSLQKKSSKSPKKKKKAPTKKRR